MTPASTSARLLSPLLGMYFLVLCFHPSALDGVKAAIGAWTIHALWRRDLRPVIFLDPVCLSVFGFCAVALCAAILGQGETGAALSILGWLPPLVLGMAFARAHPERLGMAMLLGAAILAAYMALVLGLALAGVSSVAGLLLSPQDLTLTFRNLTRTALFLALGALFCVHALLTVTAPRPRLLAWTALPVLLCSLVLSGKRMTLAAFMAASALLLLWRKKFLAVGLGAVLIPGFILISGLTDRFDPDPKRLVTSQGVIERQAVWHAAWELFQNHPLVGVGFKAFKDQAEPLVRAWRESAPQHTAPENLEDAHHIVLHILAESGLLGLACMAVLFGAPLATAWQTRHDEPMAPGLGAAVVLVLLHLHMHMHLYSTNVHGLVFVLLGMLQGLAPARQDSPCV
ncbi:MAG: O-antigen ligase family protein [Deltaproteobacteria bacterium]|nr:O-antigen ligase family protein [Deltaproteobacteria bacterium]